MMYPESHSESLNMDLFRSPTAPYRSIPFWSWNCRVTRELIDEQLLIFQQMGFGGVDIHPRSGLDTEYLSEEYMALIRHTVQRCRELGLLCWLYDDDRFPSGAADGRVTKDVRFRQKCLLLTETPRTEFLPDRQAFDAAVSRGEEPGGWHAASYAVKEGAVRRLRWHETLREGETLRLAYVMILEPEDWFQGQTYADVMNPEAVRRFIEVTHEAYFREVGDAFGSTVPAIFTDEPRMETRTSRHPKQLRNAGDHGDVIIPWSEALEERLRRESHTDLLEIAPALVWELPESDLARYTFRNAAGEQFVTAFLDPIAAWCREHRIRMTGHVLGEDSLSSQAAALGDCMRCYRSMDVPGIDVLCDNREFLTAKQAASVAHQMGREGVTSELYGVTEWNCDFKTFKLQGDWQAALGVTARVPHLAWMSMEGEAKRDWPGSIFYQSPYWKKFFVLEDYFARLNTVLTRGRPMIELAVLHPVESMWLHLGNIEDTLPVRQEMDARFDRLIKGLLLNQKDFDLISESLLPDLKPLCDEGGLHAGDMTYRTVIVPDMDTIRSTTLETLEQFRDHGGRVIFAGKVPHLVDARPSEKAKALAGECERAETITELIRGLDTGVAVHTLSGHPADRLVCQRREDGGVQWLFLCHAFPGENMNHAAETYRIEVKGAFAVMRFDPMTGDTAGVQAVYAQGCTQISWKAYAEDSLLLQLKPGRSEYTETEKENSAPYAELLSASVTFSEPNLLLLDYARGQVDGGELTSKMEILKLDQVIRRQLGFMPRYGAMMQPYAIPEKETHQVSLFYEVISETESPCELAMEHPEKAEIAWNGEAVPAHETGIYVDRAIRKIHLPGLRKGINTLKISLPYHQKTNLENLYLLGPFDVLKRPGGESIVLPWHEKALGDLTGQGMPFWSGEATYTFVFEHAEGGDFTIHIPSFEAALLSIRVDGEEKGIVAWAPHILRLGRLNAGQHRIEVTAHIGRHNGFGYLHNSNEHFRWFGPDAWRTTGDEWTDDYRLKPGGLLSGVVIEKTD
ncbi:MAG: hypothetical protein IJI38_06505 [Clostridia bacterium]|nr:hypothetical protein [Clostridia bacterium]